MLIDTIPPSIASMQDAPDALMQSGIYKITCMLTGDFYIGSATCFSQRWRTHLSALRRQDHHNVKLQSCYDAHGEASLQFDIIELCGKGSLVNREQFYLTAMRPTINATLSVFGHCLGRILSCEVRKKISESNKGKSRGVGHDVSEETRAKISAAQKGKTRFYLIGRIVSEETRAKIGNAHRGKKATEEQRKRLSEAHMGYVPSEETRRKMSESRKGKPRPDVGDRLRGKKLSPEHAAKIGAGHKGMKHTPEAREKMAAAKRGRTLSAETRAKMSAAQLERMSSPEVRAKIGEASRGRIPSAETIAKRVSKTTGKKRTPEQCARISAGRKGIVANISDQQRKNISHAAKTRIRTEEERAKLSASLKGRKMPPGFGAKMSEIGKQRRASEETKAKMRIAQQARGPRSEETRARMKAAQKAEYEKLTPEQKAERRERLIAALAKKRANMASIPQLSIFELTAP